MIEDNQLEVAKQMQQIIANSRREKKTETKNVSAINIVEPRSWCPTSKDEEFLLQIEFENKQYLCCIEEPTWREAATVELYAFKKNDDGKTYFSGEYERRKLLSKAIRWIGDCETESIRHVSIDELSYDFVSILWAQVSRIFFIQIEEAQSLYSSAKSFFAGEIGQPVHPIILDVDGILKNVFVFNATEWRSVKMSDYERYQIVWSAYSEPTTSDAIIEEKDNSVNSDRKIRMLLNRAANQ
jgi:hypothetical protein